MSIIVFKGLLGLNDDQSLIGDIEGFRRIGISSRTYRFNLEPDEVFESALLGHSNLILDQGPLTVAALGWNPPERSLHFHVSMMSTDGDQLRLADFGPSIEELSIIEKQLERLNTKTLTVLKGEGLDHALVCEKRIEIRTSRPTEAIKQGLALSQPSGDGENDLRRFIDDSVNLLAEAEFNLRRIDRGVLPINVCWPWGQGERQRVPNRAIELGIPWTVRAHSLAVRGLAKLSGFRPEKIQLFSDLNFRELLSDLELEQSAITLLEIGPHPADDEAREGLRIKLADFGKLVVEPLLDWQRDTKSGLGFVATDWANKGLVAFVAKENERDTFPFDERSLTEKRVQRMNLIQLLDVAS